MASEKTKTMENLHKALAGESIARNKYTYFAQVAKANGDDEIAAAFEQMAKNEMMHAKFWFEQIFGKETDTMKCLQMAAQGEYHEWHDMYPEFAKQAREDGREDLAILFEKVAAIERSHEKRFLTLQAKLLSPKAEEEEDHTQPSHTKTGYRCQFCGAVFDQRPQVCDTCGAMGAFDEITMDVYR